MGVSVPDIVIGRLPLYLRALRRMEQEGMEVTSSHELGTRLGISSAQIRKDLSHFGEFGKQGTGYNIRYLREQIARILQVDREWSVALVGAGNLGRALAQYKGFQPRGFHIAVVFDKDPALVGMKIGDFEIQPSEKIVEVIRQTGIKIAMLAVPADAAQEAANQLVEADVRAILNYAPINLTVPEGVHVQDIDPAIHLQHMTYYLH